MYGGTWRSNNFEVRTESLLFQDSNGSGNPIPKEFEAGSSNIYATEWNSRLTYRSLTVSGNYKIFTAQFLGSPGTQFQSFSFNEIHLLEFPDDSQGGLSQIEYNNFDCSYCTVSKIIIEDSGKSQLAGTFTVTELLEVTLPGTEVFFNGGNGRLDEVTIGGAIKTPSVTGCSERTRFSNVFNNSTTWRRTSGTLQVNDAELNNIVAEGGATFQLNNGVLLGASTGWTIGDPPRSFDYLWIGNSGSAFRDWDDPNNWSLVSGGSSGCIPTLTDDVRVDNAAISNMRIPAGVVAQCRNFIWTNTKSRTLRLD